MPSDTEEPSLNGFTTQIVLWTGEGAYAWCMWRLIPVEVDNVEGASTSPRQTSETFSSGFPPYTVETQPGSHPLVINIQGSTVTISAR